ncbi:MAG TPA: UDP-N-acetylglucosamine--undecaprenyl-phosphate N-acetylglucosaminephosphotransferase, partial [Alteromonas sp.]|nr:UDP-N-acetylglucosamine--undecaprenyl-phosphate N-acetylglucosaminephosphotransferase [Alteromonas sp.]
PSYRKRHNGIVPLTGGVAIFVAVLVASVLTDVWMKNNPLF